MFYNHTLLHYFIKCYLNLTMNYLAVYFEQKVTISNS
jgi:hypothetical protein